MTVKGLSLFFTFAMLNLARLSVQHYGRCRALAPFYRAAHVSRGTSGYMYTSSHQSLSFEYRGSVYTRHFSDTTIHFSARLFSTAQDFDLAFLDGMNEAQVKAVTQPLASITRVVAGPGAGKTRVLTSRIAYLLHNDDNSRILAVTFTKKAAGEMQERLEKLLMTTGKVPDHIEQRRDIRENDIVQEEVADASEAAPRPSTALDRVTLGTFHSVCAKILRWNGKYLATLPSVVKDMIGVANATSLDGSFAIIDQGDQVRLVKECADELGIDLKSQDLKPQTMLNAIAKIKSSLAMGQDPLNSGRKVPSKTMRVGAKLYPLYRQKLLTRNALDFDDLILMARELLTVHTDIRDHLRRRWQHVLVDEFQDTSQSQLDLVKLLSSDSLLVVGDADQSIYSWRGAHAESMSDFLHQFDDRLDGVNTVHLMENYRSTTNIVSAAQKIISSNDSASRKQADLRKDMKPMRGSGPTPRVLACADAKAEASFVVQTIQDSIASGDYTSDSTIAIVYRTNAQSRAIEEACVRGNLPYIVRGSSGAFYKRAEIQDCLCFLRLLRNGRDEAAMKRAIKTPSRGIGNVAYEEFARYCEKVEEFYQSNYPDRPKPTPFEVLISLTDDQSSNDTSGIVSDAPPPLDFMSKRALNRFIPFSAQMRVIRNKAQTLTVAGLLSSIIVNLELRSHIDSISKSSSEFSDRWSNVIELRRAAQRYSDDGASLKNLQESEDITEPPAESPLGNFLDDVALVTDMADDVADSDGPDQRLVVNLMTIHASKGMEFDAVFLIGNEDGTLPSRLAIMEGEGSVALDEEKRLCYVAMTRAKTHLVMTWRREVSLFSGNTFTSVKASRSRFLDVLIGNNGNTSKGSKKKANSQGLPKQTGAHRHVKAQRSSLPRAGTASTFPRSRPSSGSRRDLSTAPPQRIRNTDRIRTPFRQENNRLLGEINAPRKKQAHEIQVRATLGPRQNQKQTNGHTPTNNTSATKARNGRTQTNEAAPQKQKAASNVSSSDTMDSTWFYPVGSSVVHRRHGNGMVLPPPPPEQGEMLVRVQFEDGSKHDFPVDGKDLHLY